MKHLSVLCFALLVGSFAFAQVPQGISYQAIAFSSGGAAVVNGNVTLRISVLDNSATGTVVYAETHAKTTNAQGLFNLNIGEGSPVSGSFSAINWGTNQKFLKVELDPNGGTNYTAVGTNQLMSVPYALFAEETSSLSDNSDLNDQIVNNRYTNFAFSTGGTVYAFNHITGNWVGQSGGGTIVGSNGNFAFSTGGTVYAFNKNTGTWVGQSGGGTITGSNGNFAFSTGGTVYAFDQNTGVWVGQSGGGTLVASNGNFAFSTGGTVYAYNQTTGTWVGQSGGGTVVGSNGSFAFSTGGTVYAFNKYTGTWVGQSGGGTIVMSESN